MCSHQAYLKYTLGLPDAGNFKADLGTMAHKAIELLAASKLAQQNGLGEFLDDETDLTLATPLKPDVAIQTAWNHYTPKMVHEKHPWTTDDFEFVVTTVYKVLNMSNGVYNPLNRTIVRPEQYFDFTVEKEWAKYKYQLGEQTIEGHLGLKGTMDLICAVDGCPTMLELVDWKTGKRTNFATGELKDLKALRKDMQFRLYHYAISHLFPEIDTVLVTVIYINHGGPFTITFNRGDLAETEEMLRERFETIKNDVEPQIIYYDKKQQWKCIHCCVFHRTKVANGNSLCYSIHKEIQQLGIDRVTEKYRDSKRADSYTGGGKTIESNS